MKETKFKHAFKICNTIHKIGKSNNAQKEKYDHILRNIFMIGNTFDESKEKTINILKDFLDQHTSDDDNTLLKIEINLLVSDKYI